MTGAASCCSTEVFLLGSRCPRSCRAQRFGALIPVLAGHVPLIPALAQGPRSTPQGCGSVPAHGSWHPAAGNPCQPFLEHPKSPSPSHSPSGEVGAGGAALALEGFWGAQLGAGGEGLGWVGGWMDGGMELLWYQGWVRGWMRGESSGCQGGTDRWTDGGTLGAQGWVCGGTLSTRDGCRGPHQYMAGEDGGMLVMVGGHLGMGEGQQEGKGSLGTGAEGFRSVPGPWSGGTSDGCRGKLGGTRVPGMQEGAGGARCWQR